MGRTSFSAAARMGARLDALRWFVLLAREPNGGSAIHLENALTRLATPERIDEFVQSLRSTPVNDAMFVERYSPQPVDLEALKDCSEGSLGAHYYRHMKAHNLSVDYFLPIDPKSDYDYFRLRQYQSHDVWHVLTGYPADLSGELAIIGFYLGHFEQTLAGRGDVLLALPSLGAAILVAHAVVKADGSLRKKLRNFVHGWQRGYVTRPLWGVHWEEMWDRPLEEIRTELGVPTPYGLS
jgi:ubiquinone biosynthesis protein COQ4